MISKKSKILIVLLFSFTIILIAVNISFALMVDKKINTGIVQFSQHKLDVEILNDKSIVLSPEELTVGSNTTRTLNIINPNNSTSCVLRLWLEFIIQGDVKSDYLTFSIENSKFFLDEENSKYYYNSVLATNGKIENLVINFNVNNTLDDSYGNKKYVIKLYIESIQATKDAVGNYWKDEFSSSWYDKVKSSLS